MKHIILTLLLSFSTVLSQKLNTENSLYIGYHFNDIYELGISNSNRKTKFGLNSSGKSGVRASIEYSGFIRSIKLTAFAESWKFGYGMSLQYFSVTNGVAIRPSIKVFLRFSLIIQIHGNRDPIYKQNMFSLDYSFAL